MTFECEACGYIGPMFSLGHIEKSFDSFVIGNGKKHTVCNGCFEKVIVRAIREAREEDRYYDRLSEEELDAILSDCDPTELDNIRTWRRLFGDGHHTHD